MFGVEGEVPQEQRVLEITSVFVAMILNSMQAQVTLIMFRGLEGHEAQITILLTISIKGLGAKDVIQLYPMAGTGKVS